MYVQVLIELKAKNISGTFTYHVPPSFEKKIEVGKRVIVPFGQKQYEGFLLKIEEENKFDYEVKEIIDVIDEYPVLNKEMLELGNYLSKKTLCNLIHAYQTMLPSALKAKRGKNISKKYTTICLFHPEQIKSKLTPKQKLIIEQLQSCITTKKELASLSISAYLKLVQLGIIEEKKEEIYRLSSRQKVQKQKPKLSGEQEQVVHQIHFNSFHPYLLHGVTGSGKTEVYLNLIEKVLENKKEVLILVPEISLTPQLIETFQSRFEREIAILHSRLSAGEKYDEWRKIERREVSIVIGARSAVFAPLTHLGLIIIDEEHSTTYKQENTPKYHAIDIALWRAKYHHIPLILGSATPSIESYTRAKAGIYTLCEMKNRFQQSLPNIIGIDMKDEVRKGNFMLSELLLSKIKDRLEKKEQIILLLNRRGYTTIHTCNNCGYTHKCPACEIPLTYHKVTHQMQCHYCGYHTALLTTCPECHSENINQYGMGTEKLEQYMKELFPSVSILRMDNDTTTKKGSHEQMIHDFESQKYQILIGTQMIAKGLNFPNVTLVGVINGDATLNIPDFRSAERTFELLSQVAGRAGRFLKSGEVIIQGFHLDHYSIKKAMKHDYSGFYEEEMKIRKVLGYPPYYNLCLLTLKGREEKEVYEEANKIANLIRMKKLKDTLILGPSFSNIPKVNYIYQVQIIIKYKKTETIYETLEWLKKNYQNNRKIDFDIDLNPIRL